MQISRKTMTQSQEENCLIETNSEKTEMMELVDKDIKIAIVNLINMFNMESKIQK